ncbi:hypothetical protein PR048_002715 [Dryococelus australis]|uniref:Uncharacterized protein n=1 Tax=Dryococelus australis TaxID=614101 RepID=A0ABQ9IMF3_9NEOP|nr:hypothetical protein PR048_002715 [Dryococelus australis]
MGDTSKRHTDKPIRSTKETKTNSYVKPKPKKVSNLKNQPKDDFQIDVTNRYNSLSNTDSDKDTYQPEPKKKRNKTNSREKLITEASITDNDTITTRIPKYMVPIIIDKSLDYNNLVT